MFSRREVGPLGESRAFEHVGSAAGSGQLPGPQPTACRPQDWKEKYIHEDYDKALVGKLVEMVRNAAPGQLWKLGAGKCLFLCALAVLGMGGGGWSAHCQLERARTLGTWVSFLAQAVERRTLGVPGPGPRCGYFPLPVHHPPPRARGSLAPWCALFSLGPGSNGSVT